MTPYGIIGLFQMVKQGPGKLRFQTFFSHSLGQVRSGTISLTLLTLNRIYPKIAEALVNRMNSVRTRSPIRKKSLGQNFARDLLKYVFKEVLKKI